MISLRTMFCACYAQDIVRSRIGDYFDSHFLQKWKMFNYYLFFLNSRVFTTYVIKFELFWSHLATSMLRYTVVISVIVY